MQNIALILKLLAKLYGRRRTIPWVYQAMQIRHYIGVTIGIKLRPVWNARFVFSDSWVNQTVSSEIPKKYEWNFLALCEIPAFQQMGRCNNISLGKLLAAEDLTTLVHLPVYWGLSRIWAHAAKTGCIINMYMHDNSVHRLLGKYDKRHLRCRTQPLVIICVKREEKRRELDKNISPASLRLCCKPVI